MRRRIYSPNFDGAAEAKKIREDFYAQPVNKPPKVFHWNWPTELIEAGECLGTLYRSNKWKKNKSDFEDYKHRSEAEQRLYVVPGKVAALRATDLPVVGPTEKIRHEIMPQSFAELALFMGFQVRLYQKEGSRYFLPDGDEGLYEFTISHAKLGAGKCRDGTTFLVAYREHEGPYCFVFGVELDVKKDGVVG
jgi:hypothetical protein